MQFFSELLWKNPFQINLKKIGYNINIYNLINDLHGREKKINNPML